MASTAILKRYRLEFVGVRADVWGGAVTFVPPGSISGWFNFWLVQFLAGLGGLAVVLPGVDSAWRVRRWLEVNVYVS
jgi:hypothetical protein